MLKEYNNQTLLILNNTIPLNDDSAIEKGNSLRLIAKTSDLDKYYECKNACNNNEDCGFFDYDDKNTTCKLYRKEPFKKINNIDKDTCLEYCSKNNKCDFLHHSIDNECNLYSRQNIKEKAKTNINNLRFDFSIYGINKSKSFKADNFNDCINKSNKNNCIYYEETNDCVPKDFYNKKLGDTTIFINKNPVDKYKFLSNFLGLKSSDKKSIEDTKKFIVATFLILIIVYFFSYVKDFDKNSFAI
jgi:hypothetical protein